MNQLSILLSFFIIVGFARGGALWAGLISAEALSMIIGITVGAIAALPVIFLLVIYPAHRRNQPNPKDIKAAIRGTAIRPPNPYYLIPTT